MVGRGGFDTSNRRVKSPLLYLELPPRVCSQHVLCTSKVPHCAACCSLSLYGFRVRHHERSRGSELLTCGPPWWDSNPRPLPSQGSALSTELQGDVIVGRSLTPPPGRPAPKRPGDECSEERPPGWDSDPLDFGMLLVSTVHPVGVEPTILRVRAVCFGL